MREMYTGSVCRPYLASLQHCINSNVTNDSAIYITPLENQDKEEYKAILLFQIGLAMVQGRITEECKERLQPFMCLYLFPLVSCHNETGNDEIFRPVSKQCKSLRDGVCKSVWEFAVDEGFGSSLPDCEDEDEMSRRDLLGTCQGIYSLHTIPQCQVCVWLNLPVQLVLCGVAGLLLLQMVIRRIYLSTS